jgi:hypothetical protein
LFVLSHGSTRYLFNYFDLAGNDGAESFPVLLELHEPESLQATIMDYVGESLGAAW